MIDNENAGLIQDGLLRASISSPDKIAISIDHSELSYRDLVSHSKVISREFIVLESERIFLCMPNGLSLVKCFFGALFAGKSVGLLDPSWPPALMKESVQEHFNCIFVGTEEWVPLFREIANPDRVFSEVDLMVQHNIPKDLILNNIQVSENSPFLAVFTSGSEGVPKSFERTHKSWVSSFNNSELEFRSNQNAIMVVPGPLSHGVSLFGLLSGLYFGRTVAIQSNFDAHKLLNICVSSRSVELVLVPSMVDLLVEAASDITYSSVNKIISGGAKLLEAGRRQAQHTFPNAEMIEYYGASELSFVTVSKEAEGCPFESVGRAFYGAELDIRDTGGNSLGVGCVGEIWVKSEMLCAAAMSTNLSAKLLMENGWATVRDLGFIDKDGFLFLQGRVGSAINTGGYTVLPFSVEKLLLKHPAVFDVKVFGFQDNKWGELVCAAIVLTEGTEATTDQLYDYCLQELEPYSCPRRWVFLDSIDKLSNGKVNISALRKYID